MAQNICNITSQQIRIFLKAVELKNFTQVANFFNFTPSMVSKTIAQLENDVQLQLFIRKPHELTPTQAAVYLASEWRQYIVSLDNSIKKARALAESQARTLVLGFVDSSSEVDSLIAEAVSNYTQAKPEVSITCEKHDMHRAAELLSAGMLDVIQTSEMEIPYLEEHDLFWEKAIDTKVVAFVPKGNPLFEKESIDFSDIAQQPLFSLNELMNPSYIQWLNATCKKHGFVPEIVGYFRTVRSLMFNLRLSKRIFIGDSITSDWSDENLKMFYLPENSFTIVAWSDNENAEVLKFKNYLKKAYGSGIGKSGQNDLT